MLSPLCGGQGSCQTIHSSPGENRSHLHTVHNDVVLWERKTVSAKLLGEILHLDSGTLTPVVKALEKKGLVTKRRSDEDERLLLVSITQDGLSLKEKQGRSLLRSDPASSSLRMRRRLCTVFFTRYWDKKARFSSQIYFSIVLAIFSRPFASMSSKREYRGLSISRTPQTLPPL